MGGGVVGWPAGEAPLVAAALATADGISGGHIDGPMVGGRPLAVGAGWTPIPAAALPLQAPTPCAPGSSSGCCSMRWGSTPPPSCACRPWWWPTRPTSCRGRGPRWPPCAAAQACRWWGCPRGRGGGWASSSRRWRGWCRRATCSSSSTGRPASHRQGWCRRATCSTVGPAGERLRAGEGTVPARPGAAQLAQSAVPRGTVSSLHTAPMINHCTFLTRVLNPLRDFRRAFPWT